ncbi:MAG: 3-hydroxybutyryl-CoA dehydratase [Deltaproteobacteria bacterium]|jgi:enoyl-CoA hydratase/carnithine racemase|nr:3-hydroxybutyryl-CoA dehydratase [Deltaproteobacteria bacterium]
MVYQTVSLQKVDHVMVVKLNDRVSDPPGVARLSDELTELCAEITWDEEVRVVVLTGSGDNSFSLDAGVNRTVSRTGGEGEIEVFSISESIAKIDRPVIAAIQGDALGPGLEMALACDLRIAAETSRFGMSEIKAGLIPWDGGTQRLGRLVGKGKALEMILTGETMDAREACRVGLVNKVVPRQELMLTVMSMAREMATKGSIALRYTKEAVYQGMDLTLEQGLRLEADLYLLIHTTKDRTEGIKAFREKRVPKFEGK